MLSITTFKMNKPKKIIQGALIIGVILVGIYMLCTYEWETPPAISGLGFLMIGFAMWIPHCPLMRLVFGRDGKKCDNSEPTCCK